MRPGEICMKSTRCMMTVVLFVEIQTAIVVVLSVYFPQYSTFIPGCQCVAEKIPAGEFSAGIGVFDIIAVRGCRFRRGRF